MVNVAVPPEQVELLLLNETVGFAFIVTVSLLVSVPEQLVVGLLTLVKFMV